MSARCVVKKGRQEAAVSPCQGHVTTSDTVRVLAAWHSDAHVSSAQWNRVRNNSYSQEASSCKLSVYKKEFLEVQSCPAAVTDEQSPCERTGLQGQCPAGLGRRAPQQGDTGAEKEKQMLRAGKELENEEALKVQQKCYNTGVERNHVDGFWYGIVAMVVCSVIPELGGKTGWLLWVQGQHGMNK